MPFVCVAYYVIVEPPSYHAEFRAVTHGLGAAHGAHYAVIDGILRQASLDLIAHHEPSVTHASVDRLFTDRWRHHVVIELTCDVKPRAFGDSALEWTARIDAQREDEFDEAVELVQNELAKYRTTPTMTGAGNN